MIMGAKKRAAQVKSLKEVHPLLWTVGLLCQVVLTLDKVLFDFFSTEESADLMSHSLCYDTIDKDTVDI